MTITPIASKFVLGAKAAARGTINRKAMMQMGTKRWLTLPPGSVRGYPSFEEYTESTSDEAQENDTRARAAMQMSPQRNYGTVSELPQNSQQYDPIAAAFHEDYDNLNVHVLAASPTTCNLGHIYEESADVFSTTLTGDVLHFSDLSTFSAKEEDYFTTLERQLGISDLLQNDAMVDDGKYY